MKEVKSVNYVFLITWVFVRVLAYTGIFNLVASPAIVLLADNFAFALPMLVYVFFINKGWKDTLRFNKIKISNILLCICVYVCLNPVMTFLNTLSMLYSSNEVASYMLAFSSKVPFIVALMAIAVFPAFMEEITYRGGFYSAYRKAHPLGAIVLTGLVFGLMHGNLNQFTYATILGMVFALLVEATDSLFSTVIVHALVNSVSVVIMYLIPRALGMLESIYNQALAEGDVMTADMLTNLMGTSDFSVDSYMSAADALSREDVMAMLPSSFVSALIGGALAFLLFRVIARRCGRWEIMCGIFSKQYRFEHPDVEAKMVQNGFFAEGTEGGSIRSLISWPLVAAVVLALAEMIYDVVA